MSTMHRHLGVLLGLCCLFVPIVVLAQGVLPAAPTEQHACQDLLSRARDFLEHDQAQRAIDILHPALTPYDDVPVQYHADARLIAARAALALHKPNVALQYLASDLMQLAPDVPDYILMLQAHAYEQLSQWKHAQLAWETMLAQTPRFAPWSEEATFHIGDALRSLKHDDAAEMSYERALRAYPRSVRVNSTRIQIAMLAEKRHNVEKAGTIYRDFMYRHPEDTVYTPFATQRLTQLHAQHNVPIATRDDDLHAIDYWLRTHAFHQAQAYMTQAAQHPWFQSPADQQPLAIRRAQLAFQQGQYAQALSLWRDLRAKADNEHDRLRFDRWIARSLVANGQTEDAIQIYLAIAKRHPHQTIGREAYFKAAWTAHEAGSHARAVVLFRDYLAHQAHSGRAVRNKRHKRNARISTPSAASDEIHWYIAWHTYRSGDLHGAVSMLQAMRKHFPHSSLIPRTYYWEGRILAQLQQHDAARAAYQHTVRIAPDDYYGFLAQRRLTDGHAPWSPMQETQPAHESNLPSPLRVPIEGTTADHLLADTTIRSAFHWDSMLGQRAMRFIRLGLNAPAADAVRQLSIHPNAPSRAVTLLRARLLSSLGDFHRAFQLASVTPTPDPFASQEAHPYWRLAYPQAYVTAVQSAAQEFTVSEALILAIMRQESAFNHTARSAVHASGLMQLMPTTAQRIAQAMGEDYDPLILSDPSRNVRFGAWYLSALFDKFHGNLALVISSYNAGPRIVSQWLNTRPGDETDAFVEEIPFKETRAYVRKVLANLAAYSALYEGASMHLHAHLPPGHGDNIDF